MTRTQFDELFSGLYPCLIRQASQGFGRTDGPDLVHAVYCQIVTSASYQEQPRGLKEGTRWLKCRVALQIKQQKRNRGRRSEEPWISDDAEDDL